MSIPRRQYDPHWGLIDYLCFIALVVAIVALVLRASGLAATVRTPNFVVIAEEHSHASEIARTAEHWRRQHAIDWLGQELPRWNQPCPVFVAVAPKLGAGGQTSFTSTKDMFSAGR